MYGGHPWIFYCVSLCVCVCVHVSVSLSMCFYELCLPVLTDGFLWCETLPEPRLRPVVPLVGDPNLFGSAMYPRERQKASTSPNPEAEVLACFIVWFLLTVSFGPCVEEKMNQVSHPGSWAIYVECTRWGRNSSPKWTFLLLHLVPLLSSPR